MQQFPAGRFQNFSENFHAFLFKTVYNQEHPLRERETRHVPKDKKTRRRRLLVIVVLLALIVIGVYARGLAHERQVTTTEQQRELDNYAEKTMSRLTLIRRRSCSSTPVTRTHAILCGLPGRRKTSPRRST